MIRVKIVELLKKRDLEADSLFLKKMRADRLFEFNRKNHLCRLYKNKLYKIFNIYLPKKV